MRILEANLRTIFNEKQEAFYEVFFLPRKKNNMTDYKELNTNIAYTG
jgi:hypothetical protein